MVVALRRDVARSGRARPRRQRRPDSARQAGEARQRGGEVLAQKHCTMPADSSQPSPWGAGWKQPRWEQNFVLMWTSRCGRSAASR
jgi:hypothetical protein